MRIINFLLGLFLAVDAGSKLGLFSPNAKWLGILELVVGIAIIVIALVFEYRAHRGGTPAAPAGPVV
jgi:hypothetical protein